MHQVISSNTLLRSKIMSEEIIDKLREIEDCAETLEGAKAEIRKLIEEYT